MCKRMLLATVAPLISLTINAQNLQPYIDSPQVKNLPDITVVGRNSKSDYQQLPDIVGTNINAGKKNSLIVLDNVQGNVTTNTMRQVLAKVPGIHVWESDPSGIQIGIATRGLSPNRSWEFNVRQNGYDISADPFGYPEAYYNPQLQAVQRIEIVRGQAALQYGPQFGGLMNYILRNGSEINKPISFETQQTFGSNALFNSYNAIGGQKNKLHYYAFLDHRNGDGWRKNSRYFTNAAFGTVTYALTKKFSLTVEAMHSHIRSQQPGGLTDSQVQENPQQSLRSRNWFDITWFTPAIHATMQFNDKTRWNTKIFSTVGDRISVGFLQPITIKDSILASTLAYSNRLVNLDKYRNIGIESRMITGFPIGSIKNNLSGGIRLYTGTTKRLADGKGSTNIDYDVTILGTYPRDISFTSRNAAVFVENMFHITEKFMLIPGIRYEWLDGSAKGRNGYTSSGDAILLQNVSRARSFILAGIATEYHFTKTTELYANFSQAYRPIQFANLQAAPTTDIVDPNLKDAKGYNIDMGYRGKIQNFLQFDVSGFYLQYNNRVGTIIPTGTTYRFITNVGASTSKGAETYIELNPFRAFNLYPNADLILFSSYSYTDARYSSNHKDQTTKGKKVENAPAHIFRGGITGGYKNVLLTLQLNYVSETFSDANNTKLASSNGNTGIIPAYRIVDVTTTYKFSKNFNLKAGVNNLFNKIYFTRRAGGYPGPGALPADGRTFFVSVGMKI